MSLIPPDYLRREALEELEPPADERARDTVQHASIVVIPRVTTWESSTGTVHAHRVMLGLDGYRFGRLRAVPALGDAICRALAAVIGAEPGESLLDVVPKWDPTRLSSEAIYRDASPESRFETLRDAIARYLDALGYETLSRIMVWAEVGFVETTPPNVLVTSQDTEIIANLDLLSRVVCDLYADPDVRVTIARH